MSDPAVEAARRAWVERYGESQLPRFYENCAEEEDVAAFVAAAAREMAKPLRDKHRPIGYINHTRCCVTCWNSKGKPHAWPCPVAPLIYSTEELESDE